MGANGTGAAGLLENESDRRYKTVYTIDSNIKILEPKNGEYGQGKLPEESHTPGRIYAIFYADGHDVKAFAEYGPDCKKIYEVHTLDHHGLGIHYHRWENGSPIRDNKYGQSVTSEMLELLNKIRNFGL